MFKTQYWQKKKKEVKFPFIADLFQDYSCNAEREDTMTFRQERWDIRCSLREEKKDCGWQTKLQRLFGNYL
jgi:hypothetical protein